MMSKMYFMTSAGIMLLVSSFFLGKFFFHSLSDDSFPYESDSFVLTVIINTVLSFIMTLFGGVVLVLTFVSLACTLKVLELVLQFPKYVYNNFFNKSYHEFDVEASTQTREHQDVVESVEVTSEDTVHKRLSILKELSPPLPTVVEEKEEEEEEETSENSDEFVEVVEVV